MPTYIVLYNFTDEGAKNIKSTVQRSREVRQREQERGFRIRELVWTQGPYDLVAIVDAPDEESMMAGLLNIAGAGNVRSTTMRAFTEEEMERIIQRM